MPRGFRSKLPPACPSSLRIANSRNVALAIAPSEVPSARPPKPKVRRHRRLSTSHSNRNGDHRNPGIAQGVASGHQELDHRIGGESESIPAPGPTAGGPDIFGVKPAILERPALTIGYPKNAKPNGGREVDRESPLQIRREGGLDTRQVPTHPLLGDARQSGLSERGAKDADRKLHQL